MRAGERVEAFRPAHTIKGGRLVGHAIALFHAARDLEQALEPINLELLQEAFNDAFQEALDASASRKSTDMVTTTIVEIERPF